MSSHDHEILRFRRNQRLVHALLASSFLLLLLTGLVMLWDPTTRLFRPRAVAGSAEQSQQDLLTISLTENESITGFHQDRFGS